MGCHTWFFREKTEKELDSGALEERSENTKKAYNENSANSKNIAWERLKIKCNSLV